jgi:hypothetical protein
MLIFSLALSVEPAGAQESATAEVSPATPTPRKAPTMEELAATLTALQMENSQLRSQVQALQTRVQALERQPSTADFERRVQALEQGAASDVYRRLDIRPGQTLESWHRDIHKRDTNLRIRSERDLEDWHKRDHERRRSVLRGF